MILKLVDAQVINPSITQEDLDAFEVALRTLTNNNFQQTHIRARDLEFSDSDKITIHFSYTTGLKVGDTIEVNYSHYNDGLYVIKSFTDHIITVETPSRPFVNEVNRDAIATLILYPADIVKGVKKLIEYDVKMGSKVGIKSETISRMSVTYYDVNSTENVDGYPAALLSFLKKYKKMRW